MTLSVANTAEDASPLRALLPLWVGVFVYALFLLAGNRLLIDPDTLWQITVGQWILDHRAVPETDIYSFTMRGQPWISTQWLAQVLYAKSFAVAGWSGPVVLAASALAATFALLTKFLGRQLSESHALVFVAAALALAVPHALARPHVLALPVMVLWVGSLVAAADRHGAPSFRLLPLMALWANLHGGFVFGLVLIAPVALDAVLNADAGVAQVAGAAMGNVRCPGADRGLRHALWLELAAGRAENPRARQRVAADQGMAAGGFRHHRSVRDLPARGHRACAVSRRQIAAAAHLAAARSASHGARPGTCGRDPGAAGSADPRRPAGAANRRRRRCRPARGDAGARPVVRRRRGRAG